MTRTILIIGVVLLILIVVVVVYRVIKQRQKKEPMLISRPKLVSKVKPMPGKDLPLSTTGREFTYSFWLFVRDWSSDDEGKCVLYRGDGEPSSYKVAAPSVWFYPRENKLMVRVSTLPQETTSNYDPATYFKYDRTGDGYTDVNPNHYSNNTKDTIWNSSYSCDIENIPLQRWVQVSITMWNRTLDVYMNGKLARSCVLPGVPVHDPNVLNTLYVGRGGTDQNTFNGYISRFKYYNRAITALEVMSLYNKGPLPTNWWWQSFKNRIKVILEIDSDV